MTSSGDIWASTGWPHGWDVRHVAETGSTNADLVAALVTGDAADRTVLATDHQTAGRGRLDRRWDAPPGANLLVSMAFSPVPAAPTELTHRVGVAAVAAARRFRSDATFALKWPNDVLMDDVKVAGILAQQAPAQNAMVVGLGFNVGWAPDGAAKLDAAGPVQLLAAILASIDELPDDVNPAYRAELATIGQHVRIELPRDEAVEGRAVDVDDTGRLVVELANGGRRTFDVGDVVHLRPSPRSSPDPSPTGP